MEFKLRKCFFLRKFILRKLSLFDRLNTISGIALAGRGWISTGRKFCHSVVGVNILQKFLKVYLYISDFRRNLGGDFVLKDLIHACS